MVNSQHAESAAYRLQIVDNLIHLQVLHVDIAIQSSIKVIHLCVVAGSFKSSPSYDQSVLTLLLVASCLHSLLACTLLALLLLPSWFFHRENCMAIPPCQGFNQLCILLDVHNLHRKLSVSVFSISITDASSFQVVKCRGHC